MNRFDALIISWRRTPEKWSHTTQMRSQARPKNGAELMSVTFFARPI